MKREFFRDEKVAALSFGARLLFQSLWIEADDSGNGRADARLLRSEGFPYDDITVADVEMMFSEIVNSRMVKVYEVGGAKFYHVTHFLRHQTIDRPSKFRHPAPPWLVGNSDECSGEHSDEQSSNTRRVLDDERERRKKNAKENEKEERESGASSSAATTERSTDALKSKLNSLFKRKLGFDITWPKDAGVLGKLVRRSDFKRTVAAYSFYLSIDEDPWLVKENYPIGYFLKNFDRYLAECERTAKNSGSMMTADDIRRDQENDMKNCKPQLRTAPTTGVN